MSGIAILFLLFDSIIKVLGFAAAVEGTTQLGYPATAVLPIGIIELICLFIYMVPRTSILGAVLLTGYLGGAIATHVRVESPLFTHILFPIYVAVLIWGGLLLRDPQLRKFILFREA
ncbi:MAG TPA: DoxX family protein [Rhodothermales bacterium]|nr:DoxX family protein [Rhodothermales bacterium]